MAQFEFVQSKFGHPEVRALDYAALVLPVSHHAIDACSEVSANRSYRT